MTGRKAKAKAKAREKAKTKAKTKENGKAKISEKEKTEDLEDLNKRRTSVAPKHEQALAIHMRRRRHQLEQLNAHRQPIFLANRWVPCLGGPTRWFQAVVS